ncbi:MAG: BrnT family toxin [Gemmatimonadetes bacterium]|nr:BrnT family toxin [Gemmatimonadota bacterium]
MADVYDDLARCDGFDWDDGNAPKLWARHRVSPGEAEQVFFRDPLVVVADTKHSASEARYYVLGRTAGERRLFLVFTLRGSLIRVLSARDMNRRERRVYERAEEASDE